jgi:hypothetical protein
MGQALAEGVNYMSHLEPLLQQLGCMAGPGNNPVQVLST